MSKCSSAITVIFALLLTACGGAAGEQVATEQAGDSSEPPSALAITEEEASTPETTATVRALSNEISLDELTEILTESLDQPLIITARTDGEFEGQSYSTRETSTRNPEQGVSHVSIDFSELTAIYNELLPQVLEAEEESGAFEQSFATTGLLAYNLAADTGEFLQTADTRFGLATESRSFTRLLESVRLASQQYGRDAPDPSELARPLDGLWLASSVQANGQPEWLGTGPFFLDALADDIAGSDDANITQDIEGNSATLLVSVDDVDLLIELNETNLVRSMQFEGTASLLGTPEQHTFTFDYDVDTTIAQLPPQDLTIDEQQFQDLMTGPLKQLFPEEFESQVSNADFEAIDAALNE